MGNDLREASTDLVVLAARLVREVRRHNRQIPAAANRLLSLLDQLGPSTVGALAEWDRCSQPTMSGLVSGLVERGWAERTPHPDDARASLVRLTDTGRSTLAATRRTNAALVADRLAATDHTADEVRAAAALLRDLLGAHLGDHLADPVLETEGVR